MEDKNYLRQIFREKQKNFLQENSSQLNSIHTQLAQHLNQIIAVNKISLCAIYSPRKDEASFDFTCLSSGTQWAYPKRAKKSLEFYQESQLCDTELGFQEPVENTGQICSLKSLDMVVLPGTAFDSQGARLGSGQGYYDRALENYKGIKVGFCYEVQVSKDYLPQENHDLKMDYIITEKNILKIQQGDENRLYKLV